MSEIAIITYIDRKSVNYGIISIDELEWVNSIYEGRLSPTLDEFMEILCFDKEHDSDVERAQYILEHFIENRDYWIPEEFLMGSFNSVRELNQYIDENNFIVKEEFEIQVI